MANYTARANVASATAVTLPEGSNYIVVTGTTTIESLSARPSGEIIVLRFSGALTLTQNATSLVLQNAANYVTVAGDKLTFISEGSGNWREVARNYATGKVAFPATQVSSTDPNIQDDYEEGDWTPSMTFGGAAVGLSAGTAAGKYTKIGRQVSVGCDFRLSAKGTSVGDALLTSLPFTAIAVYWPVSIYYASVSFANQHQSYVNGTTIGLEEITEAGVNTTLVETNFIDTSWIRMAGVYAV